MWAAERSDAAVSKPDQIARQAVGDGGRRSGLIPALCRTWLPFCRRCIDHPAIFAAGREGRAAGGHGRAASRNGAPVDRGAEDF